MEKAKWNNKDYFMGNEISKYAREHGGVDYAALAASFEKVLAYNIMDYDPENWEKVNGRIREDDEYFQIYIISKEGAAILKRYTNELVMGNAQIELYVWCVTHWGTNWKYVITDIEVEDK